MEITIRHAKINDSESITELSNQLGYKTLNIEIQNRLRKIIKNTDHCVYVATNSGNVIGWIHGFYSMRVESEFFVEIGGLVVNKNFQKNGIGKELIKKVIEWSRLKNFSKIRIRCNTIRKESHRFYEKIGFEINKKYLIKN